MKNFSAFGKLFSLALLGVFVSGCSLEPVKPEPVIIKAAPDWVNKGSAPLNKDGRRVFVGVASSNSRGDLAMQKAASDDKSLAQVTVVLSSFLDILSAEYMNANQAHENGFEDELFMRQLADAAKRQVLDGVMHQIDDTIAKQFKDKVSRQFKDDLTRQINDAGNHTIREAISSQLDYSHQLDRIISDQIKVLVLRQIKNTIKASMTGARITGSWRDPNTGVVWSVSELDLKQVKSAIAAATEVNTGLKDYVERNAEIVFDLSIEEGESANVSGSSGGYFFK